MAVFMTGFFRATIVASSRPPLSLTRVGRLMRILTRIFAVSPLLQRRPDHREKTQPQDDEGKNVASRKGEMSG